MERHRFDRCISTMPLVTEKFTFVANYIINHILSNISITLLNAILEK